MNDFFNAAMKFINENTMLLIGICIFLILVLIGYLIDNSIKTRRLEKLELQKENDELEKNETIVESPISEQPLEDETEESDEEEINTNIEEQDEIPVVIEKSPIDLKAEIIPTEEKTSEIETQSMEDLLNKDFSKNAEIINSMDEKDLIKRTYEPIKPIQEPMKEEKSIYKSNSKLSDILGKKNTEEKPKLETTKDFSDELDRILNKLNEEQTSIDNEEEINNRF